MPPRKKVRARPKALRKMYPIEERAAIAELLAFGHILADSQRRAEAAGELNWPASTFGAILFERAAAIIRGDKLRILTDADILEFAEFWDAKTPANFNKGK